MDIRTIGYFVEVVRAKSFSVAADKLFLSQSMLSKAVRQLETELNVKLIERTSKHFEITDEGQHFYKRCVELLDEFDDLKGTFGDRNQSVCGSVSIGVPSAILTLYFPEILTNFQQKYPDIRIDLFEEGSYSVVESVLSDIADLGIVMMPVRTQGLKTYPILTDRCVLVTSPDHPLAGEDTVRFGQLAQEKFIIFNPRFVLNDFIVRSCHSSGFSPHIIYQSTLESFVFRMVSHNQGISVLPRPLVLSTNDKVSYSELEPPIPWQLALIVREKKYHSPAVQKMVEYILGYFEKLDR